MRLLRDLWATSRRRMALLAALIVIGAGGQAAASALAGPILLYRSGTLFIVLAIALVAAVSSDVLVGLLAAGLTADWSAGVRRRLCKVAFGQELQGLEGTPVGELLDRIDGDVYQVASEMRGPGVRIAQSVSIGSLSIAIAIGVWWPAGIGMLVLAILLVTTLKNPSARISAARMDEEEAWSDLAAVMEESIHGQDDVRTSLARPYVLSLYAQRASEVLRRGRKVWLMGARVTTVASSMIRIGIVVFVIGGAWALATHRVDGARLTSVWLLALAFGGTIEQVSRMVPELQNALGAWGRVQLLSATPQEPSGGTPPVDGDLTVRGLTYRYATGESDATRPAALRDINLVFERGRSYAVIGRSGSGKSTLAKILTRAVDVPAGTVFLAGTDLRDFDIEGLRRWIAVVPQRTEILAGTVVDNVTLFDDDLRGSADQALEQLGLSAWVADLPDGMETMLGDGGYVLSAGQEQLVAFARILVRDPHIVILDEATARMDPVTEARVQRATERLLEDRIGIVIAHRLSSVQRCDQVVVLADGQVVEAGPLRDSERFAQLLSSGRADVVAEAEAIARGGIGALDVTSDPTAGYREARPVDGQTITKQRRFGDVMSAQADTDAALAVAFRTDPPPLPVPARTRTLRQVIRLATNDARYGLGALAIFLVMIFLGLEGSLLPWLWSDLVDGHGAVFWPAFGIVTALVVAMPTTYYTGKWFPEWWVRQMLRISLRLVHGQTGPRRVSAHTPAEVIAQGGDTERVVQLADNVIDQFACLFMVVSMTVIAKSIVPALFFVGTMVISGLAAMLFGPLLERSARKTVAARAAFATALASSLSAARTVKLAGATRSVLTHLANLDTVRSVRQRREISIQVWARSTPSVVGGLLPLAAWGLYLSGRLSPGATLVAVSTLLAVRWFAWTTASLISQLPSARVWTSRTVSMTGVGAYSENVPGVDLSAGTAPGPVAAPRNRLSRLDLVGFSAIHEDGTVAVRDIDLTVNRGQLVLLLGPVGSGKSSMLRALAGIVHHTGDLCWNGERVTEPELFLRPNQVGYVGQMPRVLSGTVADNIQLGHEHDAVVAVSTAQLDHDLAVAGGGLGLLIGHKGTRLSGGQLQRLALARALAPRTELLIADDVSSALDVTTELELWQALRKHGVTVVGSTSKRAALRQADHVVILLAGAAAAQGTWAELEDRWGHLAG